MFDTSTCGYSQRKSVATSRTVAAEVAAKAAPIFLRQASGPAAAAAARVAPASTSTTICFVAVEAASTAVHERKAVARAAVGGQSRSAACLARSSSSPRVRMERKSDPCSAKTAVSVRPPRMP